MTSANNFTFDVVANDKSSAALNTILNSVKQLTPALEAAAGAYERMAAAQNALGLKNAGQGQTNAMRQMNQLQQQNSRDAAKASQQAIAAAKAETAADQQRANIFSQGMARQQQAALQLEAQDNRREASAARLSATSLGSSREKLNALDAEIARSKQVVAVEQQRVSVAATASTKANIGLSSANTGGVGTGATDPRAAAAATTALVGAQQRLQAAEQDVARATALRNAEAQKATASTQQGTAALVPHAGQLNTVRYALYQVAAAYGAFAIAAKNAVVAVISTAVNYESAFAQVGRTTGLAMGQVQEGVVNDAAELSLLRDRLVEMSTAIPQSFQTLSGIAALGAQLGIAATDVASFTETVAKFATVSNVSADSAAQSFGQLSNILDVPAAQFKNLGSTVTELGTASVATESQILAVTTQIGAVAHSAGFSTPYVLGLSTALASVRVAPELARGTTTRLFQQLSRASADGAKGFEEYAKVMGMTSQATADLFKQSPDEFFTKFITSLGQASDAGQNLTPILDDLGIKGARDVPVITRLANSYQLLGQYTQDASSSFASGTYLDSSFGVIAQTTASAITELGNAFDNFKDKVGAPFLEPIRLAANFLKGLLQTISNLPSGFSAMTVGIIAALGVLFAFRAAVALAGAAMFAFKTAAQGLGVESLKVGSILGKLLAATKASTVAARENAIALGTQAEAAGVLTGTVTTAAGAMSRKAAADIEVALAGGGAAIATEAEAASMGILARGAALAAPALGAVATGFRAINVAIGPIGWIALGIGALVGLLGSLSSSSDAAAKAAQDQIDKTRQSNDAFITAGGGADELRKALEQDTAAYKTAGNAATSTNGVYRLYGSTMKTLADGSVVAVQAASDLSGNVTNLGQTTVQAASHMGEFSAAVGSAAGVQPDLQAGATKTATAIDAITYAAGNFVNQFKNKAFLETLKAQFTDPSLQAALLALGPDLNTAITAGLDRGAAGVQGVLKTRTDALVQQIKDAKAAVDRAELDIAGANVGGRDPSQAQAQKVAAEAALKALNDQWTAYGKLGEAADTATGSIDQAATSSKLFSQVGSDLQINDALDGTTTSADDAKAAIQAATDQYQIFTDALFGSSDAAGALANTYEALGESIANNGTDFSNMTDAGRANLSALEDAVNAFEATQTAGINAGTLSAQQATANTAEFIRNTLAELSNQGVDTSKLDFLNQYLAQITSQNYQVVVNANTAPAIANVVALANTINTLKAQNPALWGTQKAPTVPSSGPNSTTNIPAAQAQAVSQPTLNSALASARATQAAKNLADAQKAAGKEAKSAGSAAKKAADAASQALEKQKQYVNDLAGYYKDLGTSIFANVRAEGDTFKSLQSLGQSLVDNGKSFNTVTDNGRKNFDALAQALDSYGGVLSNQVKAGTLSADQANTKFKSFARGVYGELVNMGVGVDQLTGFFRGLGVDASGWASASGDVQQYAGFIDAAAQAAALLADNSKKAKDYADELGKALEAAFSGLFGVSDAVDATYSALNKLQQGYQDNIDKVAELRKSNQSLAADLSTSTADKNKADIEQAISLKYGETSRAADYGAQSATAGAKVADLQGQIDANNKEASSLEAGRNALTGYSDAAIANRAALEDLQKTMFDQIQAYAATGRTTQEVTDYTAQLQQQFTQTANAAGFTNAQIVTYTGAFSLYVAAIRSVPNTVTTNAVANTSEATAALNAIPRSSTFTTSAVVDSNAYNSTLYWLRTIPTSANYTVTPVVSGGSGNYGAVGAAAGAAFGDTFNAAVDNKIKEHTFTIKVLDSTTGAFINVNGLGAIVGRGFAEGGMIPSFARGGMIPGFAAGGVPSIVPGSTPSDRSIDNVLARVGNHAIKLQGGEGIVKTDIVKAMGGPKFINDLNSGKFLGFARGGTLGGSSGSNGVVMVELSPDDRMLMTRAISSGRNLALYADGQKLADSTARGQRALADRGTS